MAKGKPSVRVRLVAVSLAVLAALPAAPAAAQSVRERELTSSGAWSWFGDPAASTSTAPTAAPTPAGCRPAAASRWGSYDHDTGLRTITTLKARLQVDDHVNPSILVRPTAGCWCSGRPMPATTCGTGARPGPRTSPPGSRSGSSPHPRHPRLHLPQPVQLSGEGNRIYLFWRGGNFNPSFSTSSNGTSWSAARTLILNSGERPYVKYAGNGRDTIAMPSPAHPRSGRTNIHYVAYQAGSLPPADGSVITSMANLPITPAQAELVYSWRTNGKAWVHDVALDDAGHPVIVYATFPTDTDHRYRYARWNGSSWTDRELVRAGRSMIDARSRTTRADHPGPRGPSSTPSICPGGSRRGVRDRGLDHPGTRARPGRRGP